MAAWRSHSPFRAVGIYLGGSDEARAQPNLRAAWLTREAAAGWHFVPLYVGPQATSGQLRALPASQASAAAGDAVREAKQFGLRLKAPRGGVRLQIDQDFLDVTLAPPTPAP